MYCAKYRAFLSTAYHTEVLFVAPSLVCSTSTNVEVRTTRRERGRETRESDLNQYSQQQPTQPAMNINVMQPMSNSISNNFSPSNNNSGASVASGGGGATASKKADPFASLF